MASLTPKQQRFVAEYLVDLNGKQAAIRAGYSPKTAEAQAARLLSNVKVQDAVRDAMAKRERRTEVTADRVLRELAAIGFYDIADYAEINGGSVILKATADIPRDKRAAIAGIKETQSGVEVKMADKLKALELIGRHLGMYADKMDIRADVTMTDGDRKLLEKISKRIKDA